MLNDKNRKCHLINDNNLLFNEFNIFSIKIINIYYFILITISYYINKIISYFLICEEKYTRSRNKITIALLN